MRERDTNPCLGIEMNPRKQVARFLDADELARLGRALERHEARRPEAVAAIRLLALTGCRRSEVLDLRWRNIEAGAKLGKLLGHRRHRTTAGYAHLDDAHLVEAAERIGNLIAEAMNLTCPPRQNNEHPCTPNQHDITALD